MKRALLIFSNSSVKEDKADPIKLIDLLQESADKKDLDIKFYYTFGRSLSYLITNDRTKIRDHRNHLNLNEYDFVYFRKAGALMQQMLVVARYLQDVGIPFWDLEISKASSRNKLSQMYMMSRDNLPIPATLFCRNRRRLKRLVSKTYSDTFKFPIIAKATGGTRGGDNYLIKSLDQLEKTLASQNRQFIIQEYIPNDCDYRYFVADRLRGVIRRSSSGESHLNNTSKGGTAELVDINSIDPILQKQAVQASLIFNRNVAGVDIMHSNIDSRPYFLEVNRAPQIEGASFEDEKANWLVDAICHKIENFMPAASVEKFNDRLVIGRFEKVKIRPNEFKVLAKIDTGADSSSIHCKDIRLAEDCLECIIEGYHFKFKDYSIKKVKSSSGHITERYMVILSVCIGKREYRMKVNLFDRSLMKNQMLIGRRFLRENNLMVDVSRRFVLTSAKLGEK